MDIKFFSSPLAKRSFLFNPKNTTGKKYSLYMSKELFALEFQMGEFNVEYWL
jgi:hypothetical protein